jgi:peptidoglycan hydrolase CwlO-like protein
MGSILCAVCVNIKDNGADTKVEKLRVKINELEGEKDQLNHELKKKEHEISTLEGGIMVL